MVKLVKKKPDLNVKEKILILIDTWQYAFGGARGKYPQYHAAYQELRTAGVEFPPRIEDTAPLFTPPQTQLIVSQSSGPGPAYDNVVEASLQSDVSVLSLHEIQKARGIAEVLTEMLNALDPHNSEGVKEEVIIDLVEQCHTYQKSIRLLVNNTGDEELLCQGLALNDDLQRVLQRYDDIVRDTSTAGGVRVASIEPTPEVARVASVMPLVNVDHEDDELEDDFSQLFRRTSRDTARGQGRKTSAANNEQPYTSPLLPPPSSSKNRITTDAGTLDYLRGDAYRSERSPDAHVNPPPPPALSMSSPPSARTDSPPPAFPGRSIYDEHFQTTKPSAENLPKALWQSKPSGSLPPPPSKYNQRRQFFEQQQQQQSPYGRNSGAAYNGMVEQTQSDREYANMSGQQVQAHHLDSHGSSTTTKQAGPGDSLFKDLVDFSKAKLARHPAIQ